MICQNTQRLGAIRTVVSALKHVNMFRRRSWVTALLALLVLAGIGALAVVQNLNPSRVLAAGQQKSFEALGPMPGSCQGCDTYGSGLSADGSTVVGSAYVCPDGTTTCTSTGKAEAYRWTVAGGYELLGDLNGSFESSPSATGSAAFAASSDGSVVVGESPQGSNSFGGFRWTASTGMQPLPSPELNQAFGVSADGSMIVGQFGWFNNTTGQQGFFGSSMPPTAEALGVSPDGAIAVGADGQGAFRWTAATGEQFFLSVQGPSDADAISGDGTVIVGEFQLPSGPHHAFRWTATTGMVDLGTLGGPGSRALAVNHDGSVIVGTSFTSQQTTSNHAFRWTAQTGMQDLNKLVSASLELTFATGVSADGTVIGGQGLAKVQKFRSQTQPFRAVVPLP